MRSLLYYLFYNISCFLCCLKLQSIVLGGALAFLLQEKPHSMPWIHQNKRLSFYHTVSCSSTRTFSMLDTVIFLNDPWENDVSNLSSESLSHGGLHVSTIYLGYNDEALWRPSSKFNINEGHGILETRSFRKDVQGNSGVPLIFKDTPGTEPSFACWQLPLSQMAHLHWTHYSVSCTATLGLVQKLGSILLQFWNASPLTAASK